MIHLWVVTLWQKNHLKKLSGWGNSKSRTIDNLSKLEVGLIEFLISYQDLDTSILMKTKWVRHFVLKSIWKKLQVCNIMYWWIEYHMICLSCEMIDLLISRTARCSIYSSLAPPHASTCDIWFIYLSPAPRDASLCKIIILLITRSARCLALRDDFSIYSLLLEMPRLKRASHILICPFFSILCVWLKLSFYTPNQWVVFAKSACRKYTVHV